jgi:hypothetical protein
VIKEALTNGGGNVQAALALIQHFEGMRDGQGQLIDLATELSIMLPRLPRELQGQVSFQIDQLRAKRSK